MIMVFPEIDKPKLVLDLDNVVFRTSEHMSSVYGIQMELQGGMKPAPFVEELRLKYLKNAELIPDVALCYSVLFALPILRNYFEIHGVSARREDQLEVWKQKLDRHGLLQNLSSLHLRRVDDEDDQVEYKIKTAEELGAEYAIEDHPKIAIALAYDLKGVVMPDRPWNRDIFGPNILRCEEVVDFAIFQARYDKPGDLFVERKAFLTNPENANYIFKAENLGSIRIVVASGVGCIPLCSEAS